MSNIKKFFNIWTIIILVSLGITAKYTVTNFLAVSETEAVSGTVFGKTTEAINMHHDTRYEYKIAVHPNDSKTYKDYEVDVPWLSYLNYHNGQNVSFIVKKGAVIRDTKEYDENVNRFIFSLMGFISMIFVCYFYIEERRNNEH